MSPTVVKEARAQFGCDKVRACARVCMRWSVYVSFVSLCLHLCQCVSCVHVHECCELLVCLCIHDCHPLYPSHCCNRSPAPFLRTRAARAPPMLTALCSKVNLPLCILFEQIPGAFLESEGGQGSANAHWEYRWFQGELMVATNLFAVSKGRCTNGVLPLAAAAG